MEETVMIITAKVELESLPLNILLNKIDSNAPDAFAMERIVPVTNGLITFLSRGVNGKNNNSRDCVKIVYPVASWILLATTTTITEGNNIVPKPKPNVTKGNVAKPYTTPTFFNIVPVPN